ncbi:MAG: DUF4363 family protein [Ruminococcus sp.]|nr:DUF4363 family protein [Ruminococcus sp.]
MKRIYIAIGLFLFGMVFGYFTQYDIKTRTDKIVENINTIEEYLSKDEFKKAAEECKKTADKFKKTDSKVMYSYYEHSTLAEIEENLYSMQGYIERKEISNYNYLSGVTKGRLKAIADKELINFQNIL